MPEHLPFEHGIRDGLAIYWSRLKRFAKIAAYAAAALGFVLTGIYTPKTVVYAIAGIVLFAFVLIPVLLTIFGRRRKSFLFLSLRALPASAALFAGAAASLHSLIILAALVATILGGLLDAQLDRGEDDDPTRERSPEGK
jgi:hypothetical protein